MSNLKDKPYGSCITMANSKHNFSSETDTSVVKIIMGMYRFLLFFWKID